MMRSTVGFQRLVDSGQVTPYRNGARGGYVRRGSLTESEAKSLVDAWTYDVPSNSCAATLGLNPSTVAAKYSALTMIHEGRLDVNGTRARRTLGQAVINAYKTN